MSWKAASASVVGSSHTRDGMPCQDSCSVIEHCLPDESRAFVAVVADGAGSAAAGGDGARVACETLQGVVEAWLTDHPANSPTDSDALCWLQYVRERLADKASVLGFSIEDLACTVLMACITDLGSVFVQVGDGVIIADMGRGLEAVTWPQTGEYANQTRFITDSEALADAQVQCSNETAKEVALLSDGLQYLALDYLAKTVHRPFFEPMLEHLRACRPSELPLLHEQLARSLGCARFDAATDDDKTLVVATRVGADQTD